MYNLQSGLLVCLKRGSDKYKLMKGIEAGDVIQIISPLKNRRHDSGNYATEITIKNLSKDTETKGTMNRLTTAMEDFEFRDITINLSINAIHKIHELSVAWKDTMDNVCDSLILGGLNFSCFIHDYKEDKQAALERLDDLITQEESKEENNDVQG